MTATVGAVLTQEGYEQLLTALDAPAALQARIMRATGWPASVVVRLRAGEYTPLVGLQHGFLSAVVPRSLGEAMDNWITAHRLRSGDWMVPGRRYRGQAAHVSVETLSAEVRRAGRDALGRPVSLRELRRLFLRTLYGLPLTDTDVRDARQGWVHFDVARGLEGLV